MMPLTINIPDTNKKRIIIVGCGFAGLTLAKYLKNSNHQVVIIDKNNFHQFQPLFYQVATAGLEPRDIAFPIRKIFQNYKEYFIRIANVTKVMPEQNMIEISLGNLKYDFLILANGADTSFFGLHKIQEYAKPMKNVYESIELLWNILQNLEDALTTSIDENEELLNIVVVGGGPTGVEISGALIEMKKFVFPKDYPELNCNHINIYLIEASPRLLGGMSEKSSEKSKAFLEKMGVKVLTSTAVKDYDGHIVSLGNGELIKSKTLIWAAGIQGNIINGINASNFTRANRILVNEINRIKDYENIYALGDIACMANEKNPGGHPQVAQVAIQQAKNLANNLKMNTSNPFKYKDLGSMATIGRNKAVVDLPFIHFDGFFAWLVWMLIHLRSIFGIKNKILIFINWVWSYLTYDQSLRLLFKPFRK
jgi:NADH dehydrogenase